MFYENNPLFKLIFICLFKKKVNAEYRMKGNGHIFVNTKEFQKRKDAVKYFHKLRVKMR